MTPPSSLVVVDTDAGLDDALAVVLLCHAPQASVAGVGSVHGNVTADAAAANMARLLELANNHTVPVARGAREPLAQPLELAHPDDPVAALIGAPTRALATETAAEQLSRLAHQHSGTLDLLTLGPLTNVAHALQEEPELPRHIRRVVAMAGAVAAPGNATDYAESNVWHDPEAAAAVMAAGFDLTLVPLDVTREATATREWLHQLATAQPPSVWSQAATAFLAANEDAAPALPLHDALAAAMLLDPELATDHRRSPMQVIRAGEHRGQTYIDSAGTDTDPVTLITGANVPTLRERLLAACTTA